MQKALINSIILSGGNYYYNQAVILRSGIIESVIPEAEVPKEMACIDLKGAWLCPGFIDLQVMGAGGALFGGIPSVEYLGIMERELLRQGVTAFLPTVSTNVPEIMMEAIASAVAYRKVAIGNFLGLHLEGPYINPNYRGAHPEALIHKAALSEVKERVGNAAGEIKMITLAPELQDADVLDFLQHQKIIVAIGHSGASYEEAIAFFSGEIKTATHLFNGMVPMHHRTPGLIPAIFRERPFTSIVADGIHVSFAMLELAKKLLGDRLYLISDAATPTTTGMYQHTFKGDHYVTVAENGEEVLSGSALTMLRAVQNCVVHAGIALPEAVNMATLYPAQALGLATEIGLIAPRYTANLVAFDRHYNCSAVFFNGNLVEA